MYLLSRERNRVQRMAGGALLALALAAAPLTVLPQQAHADGSDDAQPAAALERTLGSMVESCLDGIAEEASQEALVSAAEGKVGAYYVSGGRGPNGFDCSGLVQYCVEEALGVELPRTSYAQAQCGEDVPMDQMQRGDLLFWGSRSGAYHVGIYIGDGTYIHAADGSKGVCVQGFDSYRPSFAKRIIGQG